MWKLRSVVSRVEIENVNRVNITKLFLSVRKDKSGKITTLLSCILKPSLFIRLSLRNMVKLLNTIFPHFKCIFISGQQSKLQALLKHDLHKMAFSFCKGNFGQVKVKEFICVMFLDGSLKFFEQDGISQNCLLPGSRTIPTKLIYVSRTDCFILLAPNWDLECYRLFEWALELKISLLTNTVF